MSPCSSGNSPTISVTRSALASMRGAVDLVRIGPDQRRELAGQSRDPLDPFALRAQLLVEDHVRRSELRHALVERLGQIELQPLGRRPHRSVRSGSGRWSVSQKCRASESRARMTRPLPATIALPPSGASMLATRTKRGGSEPSGRRSTKHFWLARMVARITSGGIARNSSSKLADQDHRPLDQAGDFLQQSLVLDQLQAERQCLVAGAVEDDVLPPVGVEDHLRLFELDGIVVEAADRDRLRREEAMAVGDVAGPDAVDLEIDHLRIRGLRPEGADDRMQRAHPGEAPRLCRGGAPAHRFRPGKAADDLRHDPRDHLLGRNAGLLDHRDVEVALLRIRSIFASSIEASPAALRKPVDRLVGRADTRPLALLAPVGRARRQAVHGERQPPRRRESLGALIDQTGLDQRVGDELPQILRRLPLHAGRNFFGEELEEEIRHGGVKRSAGGHCSSIRIPSGPVTKIWRMSELGSICVLIAKPAAWSSAVFRSKS